VEVAVAQVLKFERGADGHARARRDAQQQPRPVGHFDDRVLGRDAVPQDADGLTRAGGVHVHVSDAHYHHGSSVTTLRLPVNRTARSVANITSVDVTFVAER